MTTYTLQSSPALYTPGLFAWAINGCHFEDDRDTILNVMCTTFPDVPRVALSHILIDAHPYSVDGETVTFTVEDN